MKTMNMDFLRQLVKEETSEPLAFTYEIHKKSESNMSPLGAFMLSARTNKKLSIFEFSEQANIDVDEMKKIESGEYYAPDLRTIYAISNFLKIDIEVISEIAGLIQPKDNVFMEKIYAFAANSKTNSEENEIDRHIFDQYIKLIHERNR